MNLFWRALVCLGMGLPSAHGGEERVAVSIRYLQVTGLSHAHIYIYSADGELVRQLTGQSTGQDILPVFSPDGKTVVFTRREGSNFHEPLTSRDELWSVEISGKNSQRLNSPPPWYDRLNQNTDCFTAFTPSEEDFQSGGKLDQATSPQPSPKVTRLSAPDGSFEIILERTGDDIKDYDEQQLGRLYRVRDLQTGEDSVVGDWPGFETLWGPLHLQRHDDSYFLIQPPLRTIFFFTHLNSTDGDIVHALDLARRRVVRLAKNWAVPIPISGEPGFFCEAEERYVPLGTGKHTVNCSYLDRWDAEFRKVRYARSAPAIFGGASVWRNNRSVMTMHWGVRYE